MADKQTDAKKVGRVAAPDADLNMVPSATALHEILEVFIVSDAGGFVGAFATKEEAIEKTVDKYPFINMIMAKTAFSRFYPADQICVIPYAAEKPIVAFASNDFAQCKQVYQTLADLGYVPGCLTDDGQASDLKYWVQPVGCVCPSAERRFKIHEGACKLYADVSSGKRTIDLPVSDAEKKLLALEDRAKAEIERQLAAKRRITIMNDIIPIETIKPPPVQAKPLSTEHPVVSSAAPTTGHRDGAGDVLSLPTTDTNVPANSGQPQS